MDNDNDLTLIVTRVIQAPRARVFEAWIKPDLIAAWWGPEGHTTVDYDMDIRVGGAYRFVMRGPDGDLHRKRGVYREIAAPERIVFTFAWEDEHGGIGHETIVTVTLEDLGTATRLTLHQAVFESTVWRDNHQRGWTSTLGRFASWLEHDGEIGRINQ